MNINPQNIVKNLADLGYKGVFKSGTNEKTGKPYNLIDISTGMRVDATLKFGENDTADFQCWGRFPEGHNGLTGDALRAHNNKLAAMTRGKLEAPVMAAYVSELTGVDIKLLDAAFKLSGRSLTSKRDADSSPDAAPEGVPTVRKSPARTLGA